MRRSFRRIGPSGAWPVLLLLALAGCGPNPQTSSPSTRGEESSREASSVTSTAPGQPSVTWTEAGVHEALRAANPNYNGQAQFRIQDGQVVVMQLTGTGVTNLSPLAGMALEALDLRQVQVRDLTPLRRSPLVELYLEETLVEDLSPLRGLRLTKLYLSQSPVRDLAPLHGMPLVELNLLHTGVTDVSPLRDSPLQMLWLNETAVSDIAPLAGCPLVSLTLHRTQVRDLSPLAGTALQRLHIGETPVSDLTPLRGLPLTRLVFHRERIERGLDAVQTIPTMREIGPDLENLMPPELYWNPSGRPSP